MEELNIQEVKIHHEVLKLLDDFGKGASKAQQTVFCEFLQDLCETTMSLLSVVDRVTPAQKIKEDPSIPKQRPKMEDLVRQNVAENVTEAARGNYTSHSSSKAAKQDVVVTTLPGGDVTIHTPTKKPTIGTHVAGVKKRRSSVNKTLHNVDRRALGNPLCTYKNNWFHWNQLPYDMAAELLCGSRPTSKRSTSSSMSNAEKRRNASSLDGSRSPLSSRMAVLEVLKDALKTKKYTEIHDRVISSRDKEFEVSYYT